MTRREASVWLRPPRGSGSGRGGGGGGGAPVAARGMATATQTAAATGGGGGVPPRPPAPPRGARPSARAEAAAAAAAARAAATRERNRSLAAWMTAVVAATVGLSYASVPLYRVFCQVTGFGGTTRGRVGAGAGGDDADDDAFVTSTDVTRPVAGARPITIRFNADVSAGVPWRFTPATPAARVRPGETALAFYTAENLGDTPLTGIATYNVTPAKVGIYFNKVQCFCFDEQRLAGGEVVDMPVFFFLDPEFAADERMADVDEVTLSYTFFRAEDVSMEELQEAHTRVWEAAMKDLDAAGGQKGGGDHAAPQPSAPVPGQAPAAATSGPGVASSAAPVVAAPATQAAAAPAVAVTPATAPVGGPEVHGSVPPLGPAAARAPSASVGAPVEAAVVGVPAPTASAADSA